MKARIKATGEVRDIDGVYLSDGYSYRLDEVEIVPESNPGKAQIDYEQRRFELMKSAMQGLCANPNVIVKYGEESIAIEGKAAYIASRVLDEFMKYKK